MLVFLSSLLVSISAYLVATAQECSDGDIRMTNTTVTRDGDTCNLAGGLQICAGKLWATVCQQRWGDVDAAVACRQLKLNYAGSKLNYFISLNSSSQYYH